MKTKNVQEFMNSGGQILALKYVDFICLIQSSKMAGQSSFGLYKLNDYFQWIA